MEELSNKKLYDLKNTVINETFTNFNQITPNKQLAEQLQENAKRMGEGFLSSIEISTSSRQDSETFSCLASNVYGNDTKINHVIVQGKLIEK